jgi:hypothetical protein
VCSNTGGCRRAYRASSAICLPGALGCLREVFQLAAQVSGMVPHEDVRGREVANTLARRAPPHPVEQRIAERSPSAFCRNLDDERAVIAWPSSG